MATITTTVIPYSSNDLNRPGGGAEWWNGQDYSDLPASGNRQSRLDYYFRFVWVDIEKVSQGNYNWTRFDQEANKAFAVGAKFSFGIMTVCDSDDFLAQEMFNNSSSRYPKYVHDNMQSSSVRDYATNGQWIPNWNSQFFLDRFAALLVAIREHIISKGWQNRIGYVDVRGYGQWGEWHSVGFGQPVTSQPSGTRITVASYKRIADAHVTAFPDFQLVMMLAALDAEWLDNTMTPKEVTDYMLKLRNNRGLLGIRRDQWGATDNYVHDYLENNNRNWNGGPAFKVTIMDRYKSAPWVGEPMGPGSNLSDLERQVTFYHANSFGNGNYSKGSTTDAQVRAASKAAGYRLQIEGGSYTNTSNSISVTLNWRNSGTAPTYEDWQVIYDLKSGSTTQQSIPSSFKPRLFLSSASVTETLPVSVPQGTYTLSVKIIDPKGYRKPMPLFIQGVQSDGSYNIGSVSIGTTVPNQPPTVSTTGGTITLPTSTFSLVATATDPEGGVLQYNWSKVSGPSGGSIVTPTSRTTSIANLQQGTYVYQIQVTDNQGITDTDTATIVVNAANPINQSPTVSAGPDKTIMLPTSSVSLTGTASDIDGIVTVAWTKVSGSGTIGPATSLETIIINLTEGTSVFRLTAIDDDGATATDTVTVTVKPEVVIPIKTVVSVTLNTATYKVTYSDGSTEIF